MVLIDRLKTITETRDPNTDFLLQNRPQIIPNISESNNSLLNYSELSQLIQNFDMMETNELPMIQEDGEGTVNGIGREKINRFKKSISQGYSNAKHQWEKVKKQVKKRVIKELLISTDACGATTLMKLDVLSLLYEIINWFKKEEKT